MISTHNYPRGYSLLHSALIFRDAFKDRPGRAERRRIDFNRQPADWTEKDCFEVARSAGLFSAHLRMEHFDKALEELDRLPNCLHMPAPLFPARGPEYVVKPALDELIGMLPNFPLDTDLWPKYAKMAPKLHDMRLLDGTDEERFWSQVYYEERKVSVFCATAPRTAIEFAEKQLELLRKPTDRRALAEQLVGVDLLLRRLIDELRSDNRLKHDPEWTQDLENRLKLVLEQAIVALDQPTVRASEMQDARGALAWVKDRFVGVMNSKTEKTLSEALDFLGNTVKEIIKKVASGSDYFPF